MSKRYEWISGETYCDSDQMYDNETGNKTQPVYVADLLNEQDQKIKDLEAKLSEKDKLLRQKIGKMKSTDFIRMCKECGFMVQAKEIDNQTAIRELEKVKGFLLEKIAEKQSCFDSGNYNDFADGVKTICELMLISIDNQIKELRGEENE